jgi:hypothetical protein
MKFLKNAFQCILLATTAITLLSFDLPKGWIIAGDSPAKYEMGIDQGAALDGYNAATIKSIESSISGFGTLMQQCKASQYAGKKIKMRGYIKSSQVANWAGMWLRVDQSGSTQSLAFDNMQDRPIKGNTDWTKYEIILDVPANASNLAFGVLLSGTGQVWFDNIAFEIVGASEKNTGSMKSNKESLIQDVPTNLGFEKE